MSAHGQSDSKLEHKGQAVADTRRNPIANLNVKVKRWQTPEKPTKGRLT